MHVALLLLIISPLFLIFHSKLSDKCVQIFSDICSRFWFASILVCWLIVEALLRLQFPEMQAIFKLLLNPSYFGFDFLQAIHKFIFVCDIHAFLIFWHDFLLHLMSCFHNYILVTVKEFLELTHLLRLAMRVVWVESSVLLHLFLLFFLKGLIEVSFLDVKSIFYCFWFDTINAIFNPRESSQWTID